MDNIMEKINDNLLLIITLIGGSHIEGQIVILLCSLGYVIYQYFINKKNIKPYTTTIIKSDEKSDNYSVYNALIHFITHEQAFMEEEKTNIISDYKNNNPIYKLILCKQYKYTYNNTKISIKKNSLESNMNSKTIITYNYELTSNDDIILDFIKNIIKTYEDYNKKNIYTISEYCQYKWQTINIPCIKNFDNLILNKEDEKQILYQLDDLMSKAGKDLRSILGTPDKKAFLFGGIPGTGKTSISYAISNYTNKPIYKITDIYSFEAVQSKLDNIIILFDDIDYIISNLIRDITRHNISGKEARKIIIGNLLNFLDGLTMKECIVIITTNNADNLGNVLRRAGRIDCEIEFKSLDVQQTIDIYKLYKNKVLSKVIAEKHLKKYIYPAKYIKYIQTL